MTDRREPADFRVLFEDRHLLVIDKPAGILTVPPSGGGERNVADRLRRQAAAGGGETFPVHRLDRDTSGVLLFARTAAARRALEGAFREREVEKTYLALVHGRPLPERGTIRSYIVDLGKTARSSRAPVAGGKLAVTRYRVVERFRLAALIEASPQTGRFNQIRLHMADIGCPLVGERKYTVASRHPLKHRRPLLHAAVLSFPHPASGRRMTVRAGLPEDFEKVLRSLRQ